jgi:hypothetical protein
MGAGQLPYAHPDALQACGAKRHNRPGSNAREDIGTSSWWHGGLREEGWKKVKRRKGKGKRDNKVGTRSVAASQPELISQHVGVSVDVFMIHKRGRWLQQTEGTPCRPEVKGMKKQQRHPRPAFFFYEKMKCRAPFFLS